MLRYVIRFHEQHCDLERKEENREVQTHSAVWLFVILRRLPKKSVKVKLKMNLRLRLYQGRRDSSSEAGLSVLSLRLNGHGTGF